MVWYDVLFIGLLFVIGLLLMSQRFSKALEHATKEFKQPQEPFSIDLDEIKREMLEMVADTIENLQPPNAMDHIMGAVAQFIQMKMMKSLDMDGLQLGMPMPPQDDVAEGLNAS